MNVQTVSIDQLTEEFRATCMQMGRQLRDLPEDRDEKLARRANELEQEIIRRAAW